MSHSKLQAQTYCTNLFSFTTNIRVTKYLDCLCQRPIIQLIAKQIRKEKERPARLRPNNRAALTFTRRCSQQEINSFDKLGHFILQNFKHLPTFGIRFRHRRVRNRVTEGKDASSIEILCVDTRRVAFT